MRLPTLNEKKIANGNTFTETETEEKNSPQIVFLKVKKAENVTSHLVCIKGIVIELLLINLAQ